VVLGVHLIRPGEPVIVVEGPVDAAVCGPGFVATLGAKCSLEQAALIASSGASEAIVLYDGDLAGQNGHRQAAAILSQFMPTRAGIAPWGEDPGSLGRTKALEIALAMPKLDHEAPLE
jgi:DNA primase